MLNKNIVQFVESNLPHFRQWIDDQLNKYKDQTVTVADLSFPRLPKLFPMDLLQKTKVVMMKGRIPYPSLSSLGIPSLSSIENMQFAGVTYKDTYFLNQDYQSESLHFHEMIHIIQWDTLGVDNFLRAYGVGLIKYGYSESPFEQTAYDLQKRFESGSLPKEEIIKAVREQTITIWDGVKPIFSMR